jgi:hypothetical protein
MRHGNANILVRNTTAAVAVRFIAMILKKEIRKTTSNKLRAVSAQAHRFYEVAFLILTNLELSKSLKDHSY